MYMATNRNPVTLISTGSFCSRVGSPPRGVAGRRGSGVSTDRKGNKMLISDLDVSESICTHTRAHTHPHTLFRFGFDRTRKRSSQKIANQTVKKNN